MCCDSRVFFLFWWGRSTMPLLCGWYAVVVLWCAPMTSQVRAHSVMLYAVTQFAPFNCLKKQAKQPKKKSLHCIKAGIYCYLSLARACPTLEAERRPAAYIFHSGHQINLQKQVFQRVCIMRLRWTKYGKDHRWAKYNRTLHENN